MTIITPTLSHSLLSIIEELMSHPVAQIFSVPVDPVADDVPNYFDIVKKPSDLGTVKTRLLDGFYRSLEDFKADVNQIWENVELFRGRPSLEVFMADFLKKKFNKMIGSVETKSYEEWSNEYTKCQISLCHLFKAQPAPYLSQFNLTADMEILVPERKMAQSSLSVEDTQELSRIFKFTDDPSVIARIVKILTENESGIDFTDDDIKINLSALLPRTIRLLKSLGNEIQSQKKLNLSTSTFLKL